jgi:hypothetical protein
MHCTWCIPGIGSSKSESTSSGSSVSPSVGVTTLSLGVGGPSSPLSWVKELSLSPPTRPVESSLLRALARFFPLISLAEAFDMTVTAVSGGGVESGDGVVAARRRFMIRSIPASMGRLYSSLKYGCLSSSSVGSGGSTGTGLDGFPPGRKESASASFGTMNV